MLGLLCLLFAFPAYADPYTPLVQIPGLGTEVTISSYLIGIYNFFLSIVGIVAVLMLILGGMRYISAVGNSSAIGDAKSMIGSAIGGLLLALLSWLFVSTINPDILYLNSPDMAKPKIGLFQCGTYDASSRNCTCPDNFPFNNVNSSDECQVRCAAGQHCSESGLFGSCIQPFSDNETTRNFQGPCTCITGHTVDYTDGGNCNDLCESAGQCGSGRFLVVKLSLRNPMQDGSDEYEVSKNERIDSSAGQNRTPDAIWDFFLTDDGNYGPFSINATHSREGLQYNCAVLTLNEDSSAFDIPGTSGLDEAHIYWVREGTIITRTNNNLLKSIDNDPSKPISDNNSFDCCERLLETSSDCSIEIWGECEDKDEDRVIRARFGGTALGENASQVDLLPTNWGGEWVYDLNSRLMCLDGKWRKY